MFRYFFASRSSFLFLFLVFLFVVVFYSRIWAFLSGFFKPRLPGVSDFENNVNSINPIWSKSYCKSVADRMYNAMNKVGTDEAVLLDVLLLFENTLSLNVRETVVQFGKRKYLWFAGTGFLGSDLTLPEWLNKELSRKSDLYLRYRNVFNKAGILV